MPRYYKDKIFTKEEREAGGLKAKAEQEIADELHLQKLTKTWGTREEAIKRFEEEIEDRYNKIKTKSHKLNTL